MIHEMKLNAVPFLAIKSGGKTNLPGKYFAFVNNNRLYIKRETKSENTNEFKVGLKRELLESFENVNNLLLNNAFDCGKIEGDVTVRTRLSGDSIRARNRGCTKTLTRIMSENKVPVELRDKIPVISDDKGVIWVYGIGVAQRVAIGPKTKEITIIEVTESL